MSRTSKTLVPIVNLRSESEASHLIIEAGQATKETHLLGEVEVKSQEQPHISLGNYTSNHPPKGFIIHFTPDPESDAIVTQITKLGTDESYELVLHIANYGNRAISAEVWRL